MGEILPCHVRHSMQDFQADGSRAANHTSIVQNGAVGVWVMCSLLAGHQGWQPPQACIGCRMQQWQSQHSVPLWHLTLAWEASSIGRVYWPSSLWQQSVASAARAAACLWSGNGPRRCARETLPPLQASMQVGHPQRCAKCGSTMPCAYMAVAIFVSCTWEPSHPQTVSMPLCFTIAFRIYAQVNL